MKNAPSILLAASLALAALPIPAQAARFTTVKNGAGQTMGSVYTGAHRPIFLPSKRAAQTSRITRIQKAVKPAQARAAKTARDNASSKPSVGRRQTETLAALGLSTAMSGAYILFGEAIYGGAGSAVHAVAGVLTFAITALVGVLAVIGSKA